MTDRIESMQIDVDEIRRNRAAIAELVGALKVIVEPYDDFPPAVLAEIAPDWLPQASALITKYNHIVDANKMVLPALYLCTKCGGANYGCGCDSFKHCTVPLYTNQTKKE